MRKHHFGENLQSHELNLVLTKTTMMCRFQVGCFRESAVQISIIFGIMSNIILQLIFSMDRDCNTEFKELKSDFL